MEVKYRAWHKKANRFLKERLLLLSEAGKLYKLSDDNMGVDYYDMKDIEVVQFTGFKDRNGKGVYSGDIVKFLLLDDELVIGQVIFEDGSFICVSKVGRHYLTRSVEVLGNIYENNNMLSVFGKSTPQEKKK